ncbi:amidohydrolase family protein [Candidatus Uabimicrobium sp. HlEnr_7]|uniref:amidohydrolase family protein n=1 Tax=Candidatus Uabimicrobium helgolandensis TaxID=3095367 RepID=UPI0035588586
MIKICITICCLCSLLVAQDWNVAEVKGPHDNVSFSVTSGTWMNLDVHPSGKEIVFDLLGDIYSLPISGGKAKLISGGLAYEVHPRYSPDGKHILFTSDRAGGDNIWKMALDGSDKQQITKESFRLCNNGVWCRDGEYIITKKHFTSRRSLGAGEMWLYHVSGGSGIRLTKRKNDQQDVGEPCLSPDNKYVYFSEDMSGGSTFQYNKDPNKQIYMIRRVSLEDGKIENIITGPGGAVRPQISPDGKLLSFVRRVRTKSVLFIHDLKTGEEWPIYDKLSKDQQETWATFGVYPNYNWTPDGKEIVIWAKGKLWRIHTITLQIKEIPFEIDVKQTIARAVKFSQKVSPQKFSAKMIRDASTSHDGSKVAFFAAGYIWIKSLPNGQPQRMTKQNNHWEFSPSFHPNGKEIIYTSWNDDKKGAIHVYSFTTNTSRKITSEPGYYHNPTFSSTDNKIVYQRGGGDYILGFVHGKKRGIFWTDGKEHHFITRGSKPVFNTDNSRIFFHSRVQGKKAFKSCDLYGRDIRVHFTSTYAKDFSVSPNNKWIAFTELFQAYVAAFPKTGTTVDISSKTKTVPVHKLSKDAGAYLHWSQDSKQVYWTMGASYFSRNISDCFSTKKDLPKEEQGSSLGLELTTDTPQGTIAFVGAQIITMRNNEVIAHGTVLVEKNRIVAIGKSEEVSIPEKAKIINVEGKTIMPGIIDVHAHLGNSSTGISPQQQWSYYASLAYGVTTTHDPSSNTEMVFTQSEMVKAGYMVGPRIYSTGTILYGAEGDFKALINNLDDARSHLKRMKAVGAFSVKSYNQPRREQRQQVITAARELEMMVYPEGGSFYSHNLSMVMDGHTGVEHCLPIAPVYEDVIKFWGKSTTGYTPTLIVGYGGIWGENYWYQKTKVWEKKRLLTFTPRSIIDSRSRRRMMIPDDDFGHIENAKACKAILDGGANVQLGAHGQLQGLGAHWEMWMLHQGGFSEMEALKSATLMGAEYIGMDNEIGSLEVGKIADLIVLDKNPLENIYNSESVRFTMINGRLYDCDTMNEIGNHTSKRGKFFWEHSRTSNAFPWYSGTQSFMQANCSCNH